MVVKASRPSFNELRRSAASYWTTSTEFKHKILIITVGIAASTRSTAIVLARLSFSTVTGEVTGIATNTANDIGSEVRAIWTVIFAMANFSTVLASLIFVVTESTVERCELAELITLEFVLSLWS